MSISNPHANGGGFNEGRWQRARKTHACEYCGGPIPQGENYYRFVGVWDGNFQNWAMHHECIEAFSDTFEDEFVTGEGEMPARIAALKKEVGR